MKTLLATLLLLACTGMVLLGLMLLPSFAYGSDYCTKEQYERDHALIADAFTNGTLVKGPKGLRDSILVQEDQWFAMNYLKQIAFMQSFECSMGGVGGKQLLYMDVRSLATGKLLATWTLGVLKPLQEPHGVTNPGMSEVTKPAQEPHDAKPGMSESVDENRIGLTSEARTAFISSALDACNKSSASPTYCSCYANAIADSLSMSELKRMSAPGNQEASMPALRPKLEAAAKHCLTN